MSWQGPFACVVLWRQRVYHGRWPRSCQDSEVFLQDSTQNVTILRLPPSDQRPPLFVVGDVHGCSRELEALLGKAKAKMADFQLVLVGDLFTKGPDPVGVFQIIQDWKAICIKGNHDWALWSTLLHVQRKGNTHFPEHTKQTLHLIRYHKRAIFELLAQLPHVLKTTIIPSNHRKHWETKYDAYVVHAGIDARRGAEKTSERMLLTARYFHWDQTGEEPKLVLVPSGHRSEVMGQPQTGFWSSVEKFRWHELHNGPELIVFGHDAKQGLFRKTLPSGRPICVGIDTGCTYGRSLTGYFLEFDEAVQVEAQRTYFDIFKNVILTRPQNSKAVV